MPRASIIIPAFNAAAFIEKTLESILDQTFSDYECIVIDDGSTDDTVARVQSFNDPRLRVLSLGNSGGPAIPRNAGLMNATGDYIFMFDSDDIMRPGKIEKCVSALDNNPDANWLFTNFQTIDEKGDLLNENFLSEYDTLWKLVGSSAKGTYLLPAQKVFNGILKVNFIGTSSVVLRRTALLASDKFDERLKNSDDRVFWTHFSLKNDSVFINEVLHQYRIRESAISKQNFDKRAPSKIAGLLKIRELCKTPEQKKIVNQHIYDSYLVLCNYLRRAQKKGALSAWFQALKYGFDKRILISLVAIILKYK